MNINFTNSYFLPAFPTPIPLTMQKENSQKAIVSKEQYDAIMIEEIKLLDTIVEYLANSHAKVHPGRIKIVSDPCNNSFLGKIVYTFNNFKQITLDSLTCGWGGCSDPEPQSPVYLPKREYDSLNGARINLHRNTCALYCGTATACVLPWITMVPPQAYLALTTFSAVEGFIVTGCMTYFWGDFGARELAAYEYLKIGYEKVAKHIDTKWDNSGPDQKNSLRGKCEQIALNYDLIIEGMTNRGISDEHARDILAPLEVTIRDIIHLKNSND